MIIILLIYLHRNIYFNASRRYYNNTVEQYDEARQFALPTPRSIEDSSLKVEPMLVCLPHHSQSTKDAKGKKTLRYSITSFLANFFSHDISSFNLMFLLFRTSFDSGRRATNN